MNKSEIRDAIKEYTYMKGWIWNTDRKMYEKHVAIVSNHRIRQLGRLISKAKVHVQIRNRSGRMVITVDNV